MTNKRLTQEDRDYYNESVRFLLKKIKTQREEIEQLKESIEEIKDTAIYNSKNNIKIH